MRGLPLRGWSGGVGVGCLRCVVDGSDSRRVVRESYNVVVVYDWSFVIVFNLFLWPGPKLCQPGAGLCQPVAGLHQPLAASVPQ